MEKSLIAPGGALDGLGIGTPLIIQDKTFVPSAAQMQKVDPTWDTAKWGGEGSLWTPHVYMPAQNPGDPSGMSASVAGCTARGSGRRPRTPSTRRSPTRTTTRRATRTCSRSVSRAQIPGTPNVSVGMEAFNDTPIVNGTAYPTTTVDPKSYRFRILNAANDRFWNL